jgi:Arc/MetJ family transcription regulator
MSRTNIVLDDKLVNAALKVTKLKTKKALIDYALHELLRHAKQGDILKLQGKIHWEGNLNISREGRLS